MRVFRARRTSVHRCNRGFNVIFGQFRALCGKIQEPHSFGQELLIPLRPILLEQGLQVAGLVNPSRHSRRIKAHQRGESIGRGDFSLWMREEN